VLRSRIIQCRVEGRTIRRVGVVEVECFKYGEKGHKCRECPLWVRKKKPACLVKKKVQEKERKLKRAEGSKAAYMAEPQEVQQGWKRSSIEELRKRTKKHYSKIVSQEARLLELEWCTEEVIVTYVQCERWGEKRYYVEENRKQRVTKDRQR